MDEFEVSKIGGAVLAALLLIVAPKTVANLGGAGHAPAAEKIAAGEKGATAEKGAVEGRMLAGYALPMPKATEVKAEAGGASAVAAAAFDPAAVVKLLASAKPENGEATYKKCASCHTNDKAAKSGAGPNFWGLVGRKKGGRADFAGYSEAMKAKGGDWTYAELAAFLHNPKDWMPGTKMAINVADTGELADLLSYLRTLSDSPVALP